MTKYSLGNLRMNKTILLAACFFSIFVTSGCRGTIMEPAPDNFVCTDPNSCAGNTYQTSEFQSVDPSADENEFVNYTKVAADYREYGERMPRDQNITQAAAGNNLSPPIPPSIEDEVVDYEEEIKLTEDNGQSDEAGMAAGEDPVEDWLAEEGKTLKALLTEWSRKSRLEINMELQPQLYLNGGGHVPRPFRRRQFGLNQSLCESTAGTDCHILQRKPRLSCRDHGG